MKEVKTSITQREKELEANAVMCGHQLSTFEELKQ
jgi:hypothetical protein